MTGPPERASTSMPAAGPITVDSSVSDTIARYPSTGPIFLQAGPLHVARPGQLYMTYPELTLGGYVALNRLGSARFLASLNAAAEAEQCTSHSAGRPPSDGDGADSRAWTAPPVGSIGYTGSYRESGGVAEVSAVSVLEARGPE